MLADDLSGLLAPPVPHGPGVPMTYRQGLVLAWNPLTAENSVRVGGVDLTDLPILNTSEALLLAPGAVVGIAVAGQTWMILGRVTVPGTPSAASALRLLSDRLVAAEDETQGSRTSSTFGDLSGAEAGPTVEATVTGSGKALVIVSALLATGGDTYSGGLMGYTIAGATTRAASVPNSLEVSMSSEAFAGGVSRVILETGLNPGEHTFTAAYASAANGVSFTAENRVLAVMAL